MTKEEFDKLGMGDVVKYRGQGRSYLVIQNDGKTMRAISVVADTHPENWETVAKAKYPLDFVNPEKLEGDSIKDRGRWTDADEADKRSMDILKWW